MFNLLRNCFAFPYPIPSIFPNSSLLCDASSFPISPFLIKSTSLNSSLFSVLSVLTLSSAANILLGLAFSNPISPSFLASSLGKNACLHPGTSAAIFFLIF